MTNTPQELSKIYHRRFSRTAEYRNKVWQILTADYFSNWIQPDHCVLDLGCGYGEFINNVVAQKKIAMDLNPDAPVHLARNVEFIHQDCSVKWLLPDRTVDVIFTSNFFEHLPDKAALSRTLREAFRCLKPGGRLIALGPNIKHLDGLYWDFYDHNVYLTETSLGEAMEVEGYQLDLVLSRFLPFTMVSAPEYPMFFVKLYLALPWLWRIKGKQFLVIATKP
jgi:SAM-dependent methyltransferase